ncbi:hypothetical protein OAP45_02775 [Candidatus Pelagibacter sp.]|nr:hypothetical protein [Candidatus Pelagibacter sp.]
MSIYDNAGVVQIPSGYKAGTTDNLYSVLPANGNGDFNATRGSSATRVNKDGLIESVATNVPRLDYPLIDGVVQDCPALLLEPQRTNNLQRTEEFDNGYWVNNGVTINSNQIVSPDGNLTADLLTGVSGGFAVVVFSTWSSTNKVASCFAKKGSTNLFKIANVSSGGGGVTFNVESGIITNTDSGFEGTMEDYGNGWYRCIAIDTLGRSGTFSLGVTAASESVYLWGAQLEEGSYPTSYISWDGSGTTTRSADVCNGSGTSAEFNDTESSFFVEIQAFAEENVNRYIVINDGAGSPYTNSLMIQYRNNGTVRIFHNGTDFADAIHISGASFDQTENHKIAIRYKENDMKVYIDGVSQSLNSSFVYQSISGLNELSFDINGALPFLGKIKQAMTFKTALTDSELETLASWDSFNAMAKGQLYTIE